MSFDELRSGSAEQVDLVVTEIAGPPPGVQWDTPTPGDTPWPRRGTLGKDLILAFEGEGGARIGRDLSRIEGWREPETPDDRFRHLLLNQVLPRLLALRGRTVLHGSAVAIGSAAVGFLGDSGMGKSTLAASFGLNGYEVLADDGLVLDDTSAGFVVVPSFPTLRLLDASASALLRRSPQSVGKHAITEAELPFSDEVKPLAGLFVITHSPPDDPHLIAATAVAKTDAVRALLWYGFHPYGSSQVNARVFTQATALADGVPMWELSVPEGLPPAGAGAWSRCRPRELSQPSYQSTRVRGSLLSCGRRADEWLRSSRGWRDRKRSGRTTPRHFGVSGPSPLSPPEAGARWLTETCETRSEAGLR